jgi:hypothetical protein
MSEARGYGYGALVIFTARWARGEETACGPPGT